jgi:hypothetical protein
MADLVLPAFEMDCRDWIVLSPADGGAPEDIAGSPVLAVLSSAVIEDDILEAKGALSVGLMDGAEDLDTRAVAPGAPVHELIGADGLPGTLRFVIPAPNGHPLALVAEFVIAQDSEGELEERVHRLMRSFRWQAA